MRLQLWCPLALVVFAGCAGDDARFPRRARASAGDTLSAAQVGYSVPGLVPPLAQPSDWTCWAASTTMMESWKQSTVLGIDVVARQLGEPFTTMVRTNQGLSATQKPVLLQRTGMRAEPPQNYTAAGWESLLRAHGPLWVTTDEGLTCRPMIHARIMTGIRGDGSPGGTTVMLIDPADGSEVREPLGEFVRKFEREAVNMRRRACGAQPGPLPPFRVQVVHW